MTDNERKVLRGAAQAQQDTGASLLIDPGRNEAAPFEIREVEAVFLERKEASGW